MNDLEWTRMRLRSWGRHCHVRGLGYPSMSTTEKARIGRGGRSDGPSLPPDVERVDAAVSRCTREHRAILIEAYAKKGRADQHARRLRISRATFFRRKFLAESELNSLLRIETL